MRIALIAPPWFPIPPFGYGGTEAVLDTMARGLQAAGHDVILATTGESTCPVERTWVYELARSNELGDVVLELRHVLHSYAALDDLAVDIVHDHTVSGPVLAAARSAGYPPVVTTSHQPLTDQDRRAIFAAVAARVPVLAVSHHQASTAVGLPVARAIHHGIDLGSYPLGPGAGYLLFLGRISPMKGVAAAIDVAQHAGRRLVIAAKMRSLEERDYFGLAVKPRLGRSIEYVGEVGGETKVQLLRGALALVNPLRWDEPFGLTMIEALACGTPVITTRRGSAPEIVDHGITGFLCADVREMVAAVERCGSLDRAACREAVVARFSAERMVADHVAFYEEVLARTDRVPDPTPSD